MKRQLANISPKFVVIVPTLNRHDKLEKLISLIELQTIQPQSLYIVDATENSFAPKDTSVNCKVLKSKVRSAAQQRNQGIENLLKSDIDFDYCLFLDDDVTFNETYFEELLSSMVSNRAVGASGIAAAQNEKFPKNSPLNRFIGLSGKPGTLTSAAINVPVRNINGCVEVEWLMGCSAWSKKVVESVRFQVDFMGSSIFEDVLFSVEASRIGTLIVDASVSLRHDLDPRNRPTSKVHFRNWIRNRFRLRLVAPEKFSLFNFNVCNIAFLFKKIFMEKNFASASGIIFG